MKIAPAEMQAKGADGVILTDGKASGYLVVGDLQAASALVEEARVRSAGDLTPELVAAEADRASREDFLGLRRACLDKASRDLKTGDYDAYASRADELSFAAYQQRRELLATIRRMTDPSRIAMLHSEIVPRTK